jgi:DNA modification methylase
MLAFALRADGWWLRSDIIWSKPNPMPESVTDRPTKAHEYLFLLSKNKTYYYDADAVREKQTDEWLERTKRNVNRPPPRLGGEELKGEILSKQYKASPNGRNRRTVWTIATAPYSGAHFATFPPALVNPCIRAGSSEHGVCPRCRNPWRRVVEKEIYNKPGRIPENHTNKDRFVNVKGLKRPDSFYGGTKVTTLGWQPTCDHDLEPVPAVVLDPFVGSGTTCMEARKLGRNSVGLDLSYPYLQLARERLGLTALEQWEQGKDGTTTFEDLPMFERR